MKTATIKKSNSNLGATNNAGVGKMLFAGAAAALGTYFLYGKDGAKNRKKVKGWALKAKGEVLEALEKIEKTNLLDEEKYHMAVEKVAKKYRTLKDMDQAEVEELIADLKKHWKNAIKSPAKAKKSTETKEMGKKESH